MVKPADDLAITFPGDIMASFNTDTALVLVDLINEIVDAKGKLAGKGYADFIQRHETLDRVTDLLTLARSRQYAICHVGLRFSSDYKEQPESSPLFGGAKKFGALKDGEWGTEFHPKATPLAGEACLAKHRVSAFFGTPLELLLRTYGVRRVIVAGCATDMAVQAAIRDAHDRDFQAVVASDCCIAATDDDHEQTLRLLSKVAKIMALEEIKAE